MQSVASQESNIMFYRASVDWQIGSDCPAAKLRYVLILDWVADEDSDILPALPAIGLRGRRSLALGLGEITRLPRPRGSRGNPKGVWRQGFRNEKQCPHLPRWRTFALCGSAHYQCARVACLYGVRVSSGVNLILRKRIEVIHSNTYVPAIAGQLCATILRRAHVMTVHDVYLAGRPWFWRKWSTQSGVGFLARFLGPILERLLLRTPATAIHTVSEASKRDLLQVGTHSRIVVVPNGIDIGNYAGHGGIQTNPRQALFIGRLVFYKNLEVVFNAFANVIQRIPDAKLIIVGDGPMRTTWERMTYHLNLQEHIHFCGQVSHQDKLRLLEQSAFVLLPSMVEGFGIVVLEAFACKKPVLASKIEALEELVSEGIDGYLADPNSEKEWAEGMLKLFTEQERTQKMGMRGQEKLIKHYAIDRVAGMMVSLYDDILPKK